MMFPDIVQDSARQGTIFDITPVVESVPVDSRDAHFRDSSSMAATCARQTLCSENVQCLGSELSTADNHCDAGNDSATLDGARPV
jgi:hypothetical protein